MNSNRNDSYDASFYRRPTPHQPQAQKETSTAQPQSFPVFHYDDSLLNTESIEDVAQNSAATEDTAAPRRRRSRPQPYSSVEEASQANAPQAVAYPQPTYQSSYTSSRFLRTETEGEQYSGSRIIRPQSNRNQEVQSPDWQKFDANSAWQRPNSDTAYQKDDQDGAEDLSSTRALPAGASMAKYTRQTRNLGTEPQWEGSYYDKSSSDSRMPGASVAERARQTRDSVMERQRERASHVQSTMEAESFPAGTSVADRARQTRDRVRQQQDAEYNPQAGYMPPRTAYRTHENTASANEDARYAPSSRRYESGNRSYSPQGRGYDPGQANPRQYNPRGNETTRVKKGYSEEPEEQHRSVLVPILLVVLLIAAAVAGLLFPNWSEIAAKDGIIGKIGGYVVPVQEKASHLIDPLMEKFFPKESPIRNFTATPVSSISPTQINFVLLTSKNIETLRIEDSNGTVVYTGQFTKEPTDEISLNSNGLIWNVSCIQNEPYNGCYTAYTTDSKGTESEGFSSGVVTILEPEPVLSPVRSFSISESEGVVPIKLTFEIQTSETVHGVRIMNDNGVLVSAIDTTCKSFFQQGEERTWFLEAMVNEPYSGSCTVSYTTQTDGTAFTASGLSRRVQLISAEDSQDEPAADGWDEDDPSHEYIPPEEESFDEPEETTKPAVETVSVEETVPVIEDIGWIDEDDDDSPSVGNKKNDQKEDVPPEEDQSDDENADETDSSDPSEESDDEVVPDNNIIIDVEGPEDNSADMQDDHDDSDNQAEPAIADTAVPAADTVVASADSSVPTSEPLPVLFAEAAEEADPSGLKLTTKIFVNGKSSSSYTRPHGIEMLMPFTTSNSKDDYAGWKQAGVLTFRSGPMRQNAAFDVIDKDDAPISEAALSEPLWQKDIGSTKLSKSTVYGVTAPGQPLIVKWPQSHREERLGLKADAKSVAALKEVMVAGQDGKVHFYNLMTGDETRDAISIGGPSRGGLSLATNGVPLLGVGQYTGKLSGKTVPNGYHLINLITNKDTLVIPGNGKEAQNSYTGFTGAALFDKVTGSMMVAGQNSVFYTQELGTIKESFDTTTNKIKFGTNVQGYTGAVSGGKAETSVVAGSVAMYNYYAYYGDRFGLLQCVNTNTMKPVWAATTGGSIEATPALELVGDRVFLYTATAVEKKGAVCAIRCYDALSGKEIWKYEVKDVPAYAKGETIGCYASPIVGSNLLSDTVIFTVACGKSGGKILALSKTSGTVIWETKLETATVSSPVAISNLKGKTWIVQAELNGKLLLLSSDGRIMQTLNLAEHHTGLQIEASPAVFKDYLIIGTTGKDAGGVYCIQIVEK